MIAGELVPVVVDELPVKSVPGIAPVSSGKVGHFEDVRTPRDVGFGGKGWPIGKLGHSVDVGSHNPIGGIDEMLHKPRVGLVGIYARHEHR